MLDTETTIRGIPVGIAAVLSGVIQPEATAPTLPPGVYADESVLDAQAESVFRSGWMGIGSPYAKQGKLSYLETSVASFACWYSARLTG